MARIQNTIANPNHKNTMKCSWREEPKPGEKNSGAYSTNQCTNKNNCKQIIYKPSKLCNDYAFELHAPPSN